MARKTSQRVIKVLVILMHQIAAKFNKEFLLPFILSDLVPSRHLILSTCLHSKELDIFYCISLVKKKTLNVAWRNYDEFFLSMLWCCRSQDFARVKVDDMVFEWKVVFDSWGLKLWSGCHFGTLSLCRAPLNGIFHHLFNHCILCS